MNCAQVIVSTVEGSGFSTEGLSPPVDEPKVLSTPAVKSTSVPFSSEMTSLRSSKSTLDATEHSKARLILDVPAGTENLLEARSQRRLGAALGNAYLSSTHFLSSELTHTLNSSVLNVLSSAL